MRNKLYGSRNYTAQLLLKGMVLVLALFISSCGYRIVGSSFLPFDSINIKHIENKTYEPRLEESMHLALSKEFINQGIDVNASGDNVVLEVTITNFEVGAIGAVDETIKEQELIMKVNVRIVDKGNVTEFNSMQSPIKITFQTTGSVTDAVVQKETAIDKASSEIAKEIVGRIILKYAE